MGRSWLIHLNRAHYVHGQIYLYTYIFLSFKTGLTKFCQTAVTENTEVTLTQSQSTLCCLGVIYPRAHSSRWSLVATQMNLSWQSLLTVRDSDPVPGRVTTEVWVKTPVLVTVVAFLSVVSVCLEAAALRRWLLMSSSLAHYCHFELRRREFYQGEMCRLCNVAACVVEDLHSSNRSIHSI